MVRCWSAPNTKDAYRLSWVSIIVTLLAAVAGILMYGTTGSSLALVFGLENCVDFLSSAVVLWRFFAPSKMTPEIEEKLNHRELRASMAISIILLLLGINVIGAAIADFARGNNRPDDLDEIILVSFISVLIFGALTGFKFHYANALDSASLYKDGLCSLIGTILAGTLFINTLIVRQNSSFWWIDPLVAMFCGVGSLVLGTYHVHKARKEGLDIFSLKWWREEAGGSNKSAPGDAELEMQEKEVEGDIV